MGKKTAGLKSKRASANEKMADEETSLKKVDCDWVKSSCRGFFRKKGLLPPLEELRMRALGMDVIPCPCEGERVYFVDFIYTHA